MNVARGASAPEPAGPPRSDRSRPGASSNDYRSRWLHWAVTASARGGQRPSVPRWAWPGVAVAAVVALVEILALVTFAPGATVAVEDATLTYNTPPTDFCPYTATAHEPPALFFVRSGALFSVSWLFGCEPYGPGNTSGAQFAIRTVVSTDSVFRVVGANLPVVFGYGNYSLVEVEVRAPSYLYAGALTLQIGGGPWTPA